MTRFLLELVDDSKVGVISFKNWEVWLGARKLVGMADFGANGRR